MTVPTWHNISRPAAISPIIDPVMQEWIDFRCQDFAAYYGKLCDYARTLNPNIMVELNPHGIYGSNRAFLNGVDHARLVPHGSVFWSEEPNEAHVTPDGILVSKIRSLKLARSLDQSLFSYTGPQRAVPSAVPAVHGGVHGVQPQLPGRCGLAARRTRFPDALRYIRFLPGQQPPLRRHAPVADVAVLRSFPSLAYNSIGPHLETTLMEQSLIQHKIPFDLVFDQQPGRPLQVPGRDSGGPGVALGPRGGAVSRVRPRRRRPGGHRPHLAVQRLAADAAGLRAGRRAGHPAGARRYAAGGEPGRVRQRACGICAGRDPGRAGPWRGQRRHG